MKKLTFTILALLVTTNCFAGVLTTEAKTKLVNYKDQILVIYPNTEITCDENGENCAATYTDAEWIDKIVKDFLIQQIKRGESVLYRNSFTATEPDID